jgi:hypothetical protein
MSAKWGVVAVIALYAALVVAATALAMSMRGHRAAATKPHAPVVLVKPCIYLKLPNGTYVAESKTLACILRLGGQP